MPSPSDRTKASAVRLTLLAAAASVAGAMEMQVRDIRLTLSEQREAFDVDYRLTPPRGTENAQKPDELHLFERWDSAWGLTASTTNGLLDDRGGLVWQGAISYKQWQRSVNGRDVGKSGSLTDPTVSVTTVGMRAGAGWGWPLTESLHVEVLPFVGAGLTQVSFPLWSEVDALDRVSYWVQPTGNGTYYEGGLGSSLVTTLANRWQLSISGEFRYSRSEVTVNGWVYHDPVNNTFVTDRCDLVMDMLGWSAAIGLGRRF